MGRKMEKKCKIMQKAMDALEEILCSYPGHGHKSVYADMGLLAFLARLVAGSQICVRSSRERNEKYVEQKFDEVCRN